MANIKNIQIGNTTYDIIDDQAARTSDVIPPSNQWRTNLGNPTVYESGIFDEQFTNKTDFFPYSKVLVETSNDDVTYTTSTEFSEANIRGLFGGDGGGLLKVPTLTTTGTQYKRLTLSNNGYVYINAIYIYCTHVSGTLQCKIEALSNNTSEWVVMSNYAEIGGWPGHSVMRLYIPWSESGSGQYKKIRFTFKGITTSSSYLYHSIYKLQLWGGYPAGNRKVYSVDYAANTSFPARVNAPSFYQNGTQVANKGVATSGVSSANSGNAGGHSHTMTIPSVSCSVSSNCLNISVGSTTGTSSTVDAHSHTIAHTHTQN